VRTQALSILLPLAAMVPAAAIAQEAEPTSSDSESFQVIGTVPALCSIGIPDNSGAIFDLGVLVDTTTGLLRTDLSAPDKILAGAFCASRSTIEISATPMQAQNFSGAAPVGFSNAVNYVATASGWTATPASFDTASATNPGALQVRASAFTGDISVGISDFATAGGATLLPVADDEYMGQVVVTLSASE
jgi:hypothetical protein